MNYFSSIKKITQSVVFLFAWSTALVAHAQDTGLVPCDTNCGFADLIRLINNVITFLLTKLFIPLVVVLLMYAGVKYILAQGNPSKTVKIKSMVKHVVLGMILVLCAWIIVKTVLNVLLADPSGTLLQ